MTILGIDPGFAIVGYGLIEYHGNHFTTLDYGVITTPSGMAFPDRLYKIYEETDRLITKYKPEAVALEELFFNSNQKTVINVGQARGVIIICAIKGGSVVYEYTPLQVKQAVVGYGRADKNQVQLMTKMILNLDAIPKPDDAADALAIAICHAHTASSKINF